MNTRLHIREVLESAYAVSRDDGERAAALIQAELQQGKSVLLDFTDIAIVTSAFLNGAVGTLYGVLSADRIEAQLQFEGLSEFQQALVERVKANAIEYFKDPEAAEAAWRAALGEAA